MARILLVDDEEPLRESLTYTLQREGHTVATAADGPSGLRAAAEGQYDVVLLDVMLPGLSGTEVCRELRARSDVPVVMLTAKDHASDRVAGLECGADDYVTKPFHTRELLARIQAVLRRRASAQRLLDEDRRLVARMEDILRPRPANGTAPGVNTTISAGALSLDLHARRLHVRGKAFDLTQYELDVLRLLIANAPRVVTRTELLEQIWPRTAEGLPLLEGTIRALRQKVETDPARPAVIVTVPGIGYQVG